MPLQAVASVFPYYGIAPIYWVVTFFFIQRADEYQLCLFIAQFKGLMAFTTGLVGALYGCVRAAFAMDALLGCVAAGRAFEAASGPSSGEMMDGSLSEDLSASSRAIDACWLPLGWPAGWSAFPWEFSWFVAETVTVWVAFALLPYSNQNAVTSVPVMGARSPARSMARSPRGAAQASPLATLQRNGYRCSTRRPSKWHDETKEHGEASSDSSATGVEERDSGGDEPNAGTPINSTAASPSKRTAEVRTHHSPPTLANARPPQPPQLSPMAPTSATQPSAPTPPLALPASLSRPSPSMPELPGVACQGSPRIDPRGAVEVDGSISDALEMSPSACERCCVTATACVGLPKGNRQRGGLLQKWFAYELSIAAFATGVAACEFAHLLLRTGVSTRGGWPLVGNWGTLEVMQMRATLYWCRILYALLSLPFVLFAIPLLDGALTTARPTGYDEDGACLRLLTATERSAQRARKRAERKWALDSALVRGKSSRGTDGASAGGEGDTPSCTPSATPSRTPVKAKHVKSFSTGTPHRKGTAATHRAPGSASQVRTVREMV